MQHRGEHTCGGHLFWLNLAFSAQPGVPVRQTAVAALRAAYFASPGAMPRPMTIAVLGESGTPDCARGALEAVSPEEMLWAMLHAIADDMRGHAA